MTDVEFDPDDLELDAEELARMERGEAFARIYLQDSASLLASAKLEPDWLVPGAIPSGALSFLVGKPGSNKSWLGYDLVCATVQQRQWLQYPAPTVKNPSALVLNFDNPAGECARRFLRLGLKPENRAFFHSIGAHQPPDGLPAILQLPIGFEPLDAMIYTYKPSIILVDSLRQSHTGDESSSQEMAQVMSQLRRFSSYGASVVIIHHTRKGDGEMRGSTEIEASADAIIDVGDGVATWRKTRGWDMVDPSATFRVIDEGDNTLLVGGISLSRLLATGPKSRSEIAAALNLTQPQAKRLIDKAVERGTVEEVRTQNGGRVIQMVGK